MGLDLEVRSMNEYPKATCVLSQNPIYYSYNTPETAATAPLLLILFCLESCFYVCG